MNFLFLGMLILSGPQCPQGGGADTAIISVQYGISFTKVSFLPRGFISGIIGWAGQQLGLAPSQLSYQETDIGPVGGDDFQMLLCDKGGRKWLFASSDTTEYSFINPPHFETYPLKKDSLKSDVIRFITGIRKFFSADNADKFSGSFVLWKDTVSFSASRNPAEPNTFDLSSFNKAGKPYIEGDISVSRDGNVMIYPQVRFYLYKQKIGLVLHLQHLEVQRK